MLVFDHISDLKQDDIRIILDMCYAFKDEIEAPISKLKSIFDAQEFVSITEDLKKEEVKKKRLEEQRLKKEALKLQEKLKEKDKDKENDSDDSDRSQKIDKKDKKVSKLLEAIKKKKEEKKNNKNKDKDNDKDKDNAKGEDKESKDEDNAATEKDPHFFVLNDERRKEAKKKLFSQITSSKRRGYICRLAIFLIFFAIFLIVDVLLLESLFSTTFQAFDLFGLFSVRDITLSTTVLFYREDLVSSSKLLSPRIFI